jgi:hypothetical protein
MAEFLVLGWWGPVDCEVSVHAGNRETDTPMSRVGFDKSGLVQLPESCQDVNIFECARKCHIKFKHGFFELQFRTHYTGLAVRVCLLMLLNRYLNADPEWPLCCCKHATLSKETQSCIDVRKHKALSCVALSHDEPVREKLKAMFKLTSINWTTRNVRQLLVPAVPAHHGVITSEWKHASLPQSWMLRSIKFQSVGLYFQVFIVLNDYHWVITRLNRIPETASSDLGRGTVGYILRYFMIFLSPFKRNLQLGHAKLQFPHFPIHQLDNVPQTKWPTFI